MSTVKCQIDFLLKLLEFNSNTTQQKPEVNQNNILTSNHQKAECTVTVVYDDYDDLDD